MQIVPWWRIRRCQSSRRQFIAIFFNSRALGRSGDWTHRVVELIWQSELGADGLWRHADASPHMIVGRP